MSAEPLQLQPQSSVHPQPSIQPMRPVQRQPSIQPKDLKYKCQGNSEDIEKLADTFSKYGLPEIREAFSAVSDRDVNRAKNYFTDRMPKITVDIKERRQHYIFERTKQGGGTEKTEYSFNDENKIGAGSFNNIFSGTSLTSQENVVIKLTSRKVSYVDMLSETLISVILSGLGESITNGRIFPTVHICGIITMHNQEHRVCTIMKKYDGDLQTLLSSGYYEDDLKCKILAQALHDVNCTQSYLQNFRFNHNDLHFKNIFYKIIDGEYAFYMADFGNSRMEIDFRNGVDSIHYTLGRAIPDARKYISMYADNLTFITYAKFVHGHIFSQCVRQYMSNITNKISNIINSLLNNIRSPELARDTMKLIAFIPTLSSDKISSFPDIDAISPAKIKNLLERHYPIFKRCEEHIDCGLDKEEKEEDEEDSVIKVSLIANANANESDNDSDGDSDFEDEVLSGGCHKYRINNKYKLMYRRHKTNYRVLKCN